VTIRTLIQRGATYHWRTNLAVIAGVAAAVSVLGGALLVGDSVRGSLREIAVGRLGQTQHVVNSQGFFREALADDLSQRTSRPTTPLVVASGVVTHEASSRRASSVRVYGVDERFWKFHGLNHPDGVYVSPALASEFAARPGDVLLTRLQRPSEIPLESLYARKDEVGRTVRLTLTGALPREQLGEFALEPQQAELRAVFVPLRRVQRDLAVPNQVNTVLVGGSDDAVQANALRSAITLQDLGVRVSVVGKPPMVAVESASGILSEQLESAARSAAGRLNVQPRPIFTYLANTIRTDRRQIPYSLVTATELAWLEQQLLLPIDAFYPPPMQAGAPQRYIVLNEWAAREIAAKSGDRVEIEYYLWDPAAGLQTKTAVFTVAGTVPIEGLAADRRLAPEYPGISAAGSLADWDPPFPIDLSRVRKQDEEYWDRYRTTPKAFISYEEGRRLWQTRYGNLTALRFEVPEGSDTNGMAERLRSALRDALDPVAMGVAIIPARRLALRASQGATDFGEYFTYFSFFLVVAALLLAVLFFRLGVEQRLRQIGVLRASGFTLDQIRQLLLLEGLALAVAGSAIGIGGAIAYGRVIIYALETWWSGAVGTTLLRLHVSPLTLALGALGGVVAAVLCIVVSLRAVAKLSPRALLTGQAVDTNTTLDPRRARRSRLAASAFAMIGVGLVVAGFFSDRYQAGAFFGAGAALLIACLDALAAWLRGRQSTTITGRGAAAVTRLGFRSAAFRPARSVLSTALIASAAFIIVSVEAFRRGADTDFDPRSGTGGFALVARAELPIVHNPNEPAGREALLVQAPELSRTRFARFRMRPGEDASCLNLYRPTSPTIISPEDSFLEAGRFSFTTSLAESGEERANPWLLLKRRFDDGAVPVIADATSLQYVLHAAVGDDFSMDIGASTPLRLRFVGALRDSVLQGELIMGEEHFGRLFPDQQGFRFFLIEDTSARSLEAARALASVVERELEPFGVDAVSTVERLAAFHRVENTYLSTFQSLGGLGLLLGTVGLATVMFRNVLERRRELALLRAVGYNARSVSLMIVAEAAFLLGVGLAAGAACAAIAIAPAWLGRGGSVPGPGLFALLGAVLVAGLVSSAIATRAALKGNMLEALRAE
jgi:putative ABC transport system permease protein